MTREEAIAILQEKYDCCKSFYDLAAHPEEDYPEMAKYLQALQIALSALRPVSREQVEKVWSPCNFYAGAKYITGGVTAVYPVSETRQQETLAEGDFDFCPVCGRPLTDEAVEMVMERLEALKDGSSTD